MVLQKEEGNKQKEKVKITSEWMCGGSLEREENKIKIVWLWWEVDVTIGRYGGGNTGWNKKRGKFCFGFRLKLNF